MSLQGFVLVHCGFCPGFLSGRFCLGWFLFVPPSVRIHMLQHKAKHHFNFRFYMYEIFLKCDVTCSWTPFPLSQTVTPRTPSPSSVTYFMYGPIYLLLFQLVHTLCVSLTGCNDSDMMSTQCESSNPLYLYP